MIDDDFEKFSMNYHTPPKKKISYKKFLWAGIFFGTLLNLFMTFIYEFFPEHRDLIFFLNCIPILGSLGIALYLDLEDN